MKHVKTMTRVDVRAAQLPAGDLITVLISILTALGALLGVLLPIFEDKQK